MLLTWQQQTEDPPGAQAFDAHGNRYVVTKLGPKNWKMSAYTYFADYGTEGHKTEAIAKAQAEQIAKETAEKYINPPGSDCVR
jgi:hypothetical protein